ncbi:inner membrane protein [Pasteurella testudinis DSM 23072]|uniref:Inner membrane protein n=1 Tax=Pasteurella testudinis DSM 23072 TaxID=1122938 RepID=A0A1W1UIY9_9PAST|nr:YgjV family protein [Pasteurella testudinis]SMB81037.1 inner membrane protein [Pasteurella testudinis DSM 23072]SUB52009.1 inner membrane,YgjV-like protein [Pasteurella testudinis]
MSIEILGYIATAFVAGSFLLSSILHLRIVNSIGAVLYIVYGALIASMPVVLLNVFITAVNVYQIIKLKRQA